MLWKHLPMLVSLLLWITVSINKRNTNREVCIVDEGWNSTVRRGHMTIFFRQFCIGGSVVEFSPATREARVRFPANAISIFYLDLLSSFMVSKLKISAVVVY